MDIFGLPSFSDHCQKSLKALVLEMQELWLPLANLSSSCTIFFYLTKPISKDCLFSCSVLFSVLLVNFHWVCVFWTEVGRELHTAVDYWPVTWMYMYSEPNLHVVILYMYMYSEPTLHVVILYMYMYSEPTLHVVILYHIYCIYRQVWNIPGHPMAPLNPFHSQSCQEVALSRRWPITLSSNNRHTL